MKIEFITKSYEGHAVAFALDRDQSDSYTDSIRRGNTIASQHTNRYARTLTEKLNRPIKMVDAGANIGTITLPCAVAYKSRILAVEALPQNYTLLLSAVKANAAAHSIVPVHVALYGEMGVVNLTGSSAWGGISETGTAVPSAPLVDVIDTFGFSDADLVKIDIEGAELSSLTGFERLAALPNGPDVIYESNSHTCGRFGYRTQDLARWFENNGYSLYVFEDNNTLVRLSSTTPQWRLVSDVLATKKLEPDIVSMQYTIRELTNDLLVQSFAKVGKGPHGDRFIEVQEPFLPREVRTSAEWANVRKR